MDGIPTCDERVVIISAPEEGPEVEHGAAQVRHQTPPAQRLTRQGFSPEQCLGNTPIIHSIFKEVGTLSEILYGYRTYIVSAMRTMGVRSTSPPSPQHVQACMSRALSCAMANSDLPLFDCHRRACTRCTVWRQMATTPCPVAQRNLVMASLACWSATLRRDPSLASAPSVLL